jgi:hypothetical protein
MSARGTEQQLFGLSFTAAEVLRTYGEPCRMTGIGANGPNRELHGVRRAEFLEYDKVIPA